VPRLVALYDIQPGNGARLFLRPWSPHGQLVSSTGRRFSIIFWFIVLLCYFMMCLSCPSVPCDIFHTPVALYRLFVLKLMLNINQLMTSLIRVSDVIRIVLYFSLSMPDVLAACMTSWRFWSWSV